MNNTPVYDELNKAWKSTCRVLFGEEIGELKEEVAKLKEEREETKKKAEREEEPKRRRRFEAGPLEEEI